MASTTTTNATTSLIHFLDLDDYGLTDVPAERKEEAKEEVADYLKNEMLRTLDKGTSPVKGEGRFRILNDKYATTFKGGVRTSNLELEGDLKDSLIVKSSTGSFLKIGHEGEEVPKADGHNQISSKAKAWAFKSGMPKRRYIPDDNQKFVDNITGEISLIINDFKAEEVSQDSGIDITAFLSSDKGKISETQLKDDVNYVGIDDLFSDDFIGDLLEDALRRRQ